MEFIFTSHARQRMYERGISVEEIKGVVEKGMKWPSRDAGKWHAKMGNIEVVFERKKSVTRVVTVYWSG